MSIGNWYRVGTVSVQNGNVNVVGTNTFWTTQCNPGDRFTVDGENWYEIVTITDDTHLAIESVGGSGAFAGATAANLPYAIDRNFNNALSGGLAAQVAALLAQFQAGANGPLSGLFQNGSAATPGIAFLNEASTGLFRPAAGIAALAVQGAEFLRAVGTVNGVPAMLGLGTATPAQMVDLAASNSALWGVRMTNSSVGTAARAGFIAGNGAQNLNIGVNGASFTANGVLTPARGFVEGPSGIDFASGVTAGNAFTWGVGASYASKMAMDYQGNVTLTGGTLTLADGSAWGSAGLNITGTYAANMLNFGPTMTVAIGPSFIGPSLSPAIEPSVALPSGCTAISLGSKLTGSSQAVSSFNALQIVPAIDASYTGVLSVVHHLRLGGLSNNSANAVAEVDQLAISSLNNGNGITAGAITNNAINITIPIAAAGAGGTITNNGLFITGGAAAGTGTTNNWAINSQSTASSYFAGPVGVGTVTTTGARLTVQPTNSSSSRTLILVSGDGSNILYTDLASQSYVSGQNAASTALIVQKHSTTSRSINAAGTLNASGADYAEYRQIIPALYGTVMKGALLGYDADGLMTNVFAHVVGRVLPKSTNPSYVGGDTWGIEASIATAYAVAVPGNAPVEVPVPVVPAVVAAPGAAPATVAAPGDGASPAEISAYDENVAAREAHAEAVEAYATYQDATLRYPQWQASYATYLADLAAYEARLMAFNAALETERLKWDRIALCGVVPINLAGLTAADVGKYLVPCAAPDGTITATAVARSDLSLGQYIDSFGTIERIGADGRPLVNVKNG